MIKAIAAMCENRGIGKNNTIPWRSSPDFRWFKEFTLNNTLIMGRKTFDFMPALKNRNIVVLSNSIADRIVYHATNRHKCNNLYVRNSNEFNISEFPEAIVAGGAYTYEKLFPEIVEFYVTYIKGIHECDTFMPQFEHFFKNKEEFRILDDGNIVIKYSK